MTRIKPVLQALLLGAVYSVLSWTVMAQEPLSKAGEPHKVAAPAKEELASAPTKVDVNPVARDEEILKRLQNILDATNSEAVVIEEQARQAQPLKNGVNLLPVASGARTAEKQT